MLSPESHLWDEEFEKEVADHFNSNEYKEIMKNQNTIEILIFMRQKYHML